MILAIIIAIVVARVLLSGTFWRLVMALALMAWLYTAFGGSGFMVLVAALVIWGVFRPRKNTYRIHLTKC